MFRNLLPGVEEEQLLRLRPEVLREICSDAGVSAAVTRLVRLQPAGNAAAELGVARYTGACKFCTSHF